MLAILLALDAEGRAGITKVELGALVGIKERQVANVLKDLEGEVLAFIKKQPRGGAGKGRAANTYDIRPDATGNVVPATWFRQQPIAGNAVPSASPDQQSITGTTLPVAQIEDAEFVDNPAAPISTGAHAQKLTLNTTLSELNPEPVELASTSAARDAKPMKLNGSAKAMDADALLANLIRIVGSPILEEAKVRLGKTAEFLPLWIADGADFDADIVPTVREVCGRMGGERLRSLKYFDDAVRIAARSRIAILSKKPNPIEAGNDFDAPSAARNVSVSRGKISPGSAHYLRELERAANDERRVESVAGK